MKLPDLSPILTEEELDAIEQVRKATKPIEDPTVLLILFHAVERLAMKVKHMREVEEDAAQAIKDHLTLQPTAVEYEHGLNVLKHVADDLLFNDEP